MWTYEAPTVEKQPLRDAARWDPHIHRGLKMRNLEEKLSLRKLQAKLEKEWQRTEEERAWAKSCPGADVSVIQHKDGTVWVRDGVKSLTDAHQRSFVSIPLAHYWDVILRGEAWGQFSWWDAWEAMRRKEKKTECQMAQE